MINALIAEVPTRIAEEGRAAGDSIWDAEFNVAAWLKLKGKGEVSLLLCHHDDAGQHGSVVERCMVDGEAAPLLSGVVSVRITGKIKKVEVVLKLSDDEMRFQVDEVYVQRKKADARQANKKGSRN